MENKLFIEYQLGDYCHTGCEHKVCELYRNISRWYCEVCSSPVGERAKYVVDKGIFFHAACKNLGKSLP